MNRFSWERLDHGKAEVWDKQEETVVWLTFVEDDRVLDGLVAIANYLNFRMEEQIDTLKGQIDRLITLSSYLAYAVEKGSE